MDVESVNVFALDEVGAVGPRLQGHCSISPSAVAITLDAEAPHGFVAHALDADDLVLAEKTWPAPAGKGDVVVWDLTAALE